MLSRGGRQPLARAPLENIMKLNEGSYFKFSEGLGYLGWWEGPAFQPLVSNSLHFRIIIIRLCACVFQYSFSPHHHHQFICFTDSMENEEQIAQMCRLKIAQNKDTKKQIHFPFIHLDVSWVPVFTKPLLKKKNPFELEYLGTFLHPFKKVTYSNVLVPREILQGSKAKAVIWNYITWSQGEQK